MNLIGLLRRYATFSTFTKSTSTSNSIHSLYFLSSNFNHVSTFNKCYQRFLCTTTAHNVLCNTSIILAGAPGSGKSKVGAMLAKRLKRVFQDFDDDVLEKEWRESVSSYLNRVGDEAFLRAESNIAKQYTVATSSILSLSGSIPLCPEAMQHLRKQGIIVLLDASSDTIVSRAKRMRVNRIVGQASHTLSNILKLRTPLYEQCYDIRVIIGDDDSIEQVVHKVLLLLSHQSSSSSSSFISSRGVTHNDTGECFSFTDVLQLGLAPDRGLFLPQQMPIPFALNELKRLIDLPFTERAIRSIERFPLGALHPSKLRAFIESAYSSFAHDDVVPLTHLQSNIYMLEAYHGPTASFKDVALQLTPQLMAYAVQHHPLNNSTTSSQLALLVATSGDTGVATLDGFRRHNIPVAVLFPQHGVSRIQKHQMMCIDDETSLNSSCVLGVNNDFDRCQTLVKDMLENVACTTHLHSTCGAVLSCGNSINWGRLLPQIVFSVSAYLDLVKQGRIILGEAMDIIVPTGNFGNILGAYYARALGIPIRRLICASNKNNALSNFINTGSYDLRSRALSRTYSPSVDILISSNLERYIFMISGYDADLVTSLYADLKRSQRFDIPLRLRVAMQKELYGDWCSEENSLRVINDTLSSTGVLLDPHTSLARHVAESMISNNSSATPIVISSTAHFSKFPDAIFAALGQENSSSQSIADVFSRLEQIKTCTPMHHELQRVSQLIEHDSECITDKSESVRQRIFDFFASSVNKLRTDNSSLHVPTPIFSHSPKQKV